MKSIAITANAAPQTPATDPNPQPYEVVRFNA
jgi:hypothetical protein